MAAQYDVNLEKCALFKCLRGSRAVALTTGQMEALVHSLAIEILDISGHTDKSNTSLNL